VCSCTIVPLFAGIYRKGAGLGPAVTFLFFAPAANILALFYTGGIIGPDLAVARLLLSLIFGIGIGLIMALIFRADDAAHGLAIDNSFAAPGEGMGRAPLLFLLLLVALLLGGTLKIGLLTDTYAHIQLPFAAAQGWQDMLDRLVPYDAARGEEGVSVQGAVLITLLAAIGASAWRGLEGIQEGANRWTAISLGLIAATLLLAALSIQVVPAGWKVGLTGKFFATAFSMGALYALARQRMSEDQIRDWLWESWRFLKQIFPLLVVGVFVVGMLRVLIRPEWIEMLAGSNSLVGNLAGVAFGVFMYFPTLVEVPIAKMFLDLGMHRGPLLSYLMSDPELSLQSILIISAIIGRRKAATYVGLVAIFSTAAGLTYGAWIDGASLLVLGAWLSLFVTALAALLSVASHRGRSALKGA
jgi:uncharacterized membrane protein YraQ (UPF0718 family)